MLEYVSYVSSSGPYLVWTVVVCVQFQNVLKTETEIKLKWMSRSTDSSRDLSLIWVLVCVCEGDGCYIVNALTATFNTQSTRYLSLAGELWIIFSEQFVF